LVLALCGVNVAAQNLVREQHILEDPSGQMSFAQVQAAVFTPTQDVIPRFGSASAFWLRLTINVPPTPETLVLSMRPARVKLLSVFTPPTSATSSDWFVSSLNQLSGASATLPKLAPGLQSVYLHVETKTLLAQAVVQTQQTLTQQQMYSHAVFGGVVSSFVLIIFVLSTAKLQRLATMKYFILLHLLTCLLHYFVVSDVSANYISIQEPWLTWIVRLVTTLNFLSFFLLLQSFFVFLNLKKAQYSVNCCLFVSMYLIVFIYAIKGSQQAFAVTTFIQAVTVFATSIGMFAACVWFLKQKHTRAWPDLLLAGVLMFLTLTISWVTLQLSGYLQLSTLLFDILPFRNLFFGTCMVLFLWSEDLQIQTQLKRNQSMLASAAELTALKAEQLAIQESFTAMLMHELKTPIFTIQLATSALVNRDDLLQAEKSRLLSISRSADDINVIVNRCVEADRLVQDQLPQTKEPVVVETLLQELAQLPGKERIVISGLAKSIVFADFQYIRIILVNLVNNALKYSPTGSDVTLNVQAGPHAALPSLCFRVSNTVGPAGRPDPLKVFSRYYRGAGAKKEPGAGLGLWLASTIASKMGTQLLFDSDDSQVHFYFSLELYDAAEP
jgi:signal transduction histidine kinase